MVFVLPNEGGAEAQVFEFGGREKLTTNNRMEMTAVLRTLEEAKKMGVLRGEIVSDSSYVILGLTKWIFAWQRNNFKTADKKDVLNKDLWEALLIASAGLKISYRQVRGHAGVPGNERADQIATYLATDREISLFAGAKRDYPFL